MNKVLLLSFLVRFALTPIIAFSGKSYYKLVFILIFLDIIDCNPIVIKLFSKEELEKQTYCDKNPFYTLVDKCLDLYQYLFAIVLLHSIFSVQTFYVLLLLIFYRVIGVVQYYKDRNSENFIYFPDLIKEYIVLVALFGDNIPLPALLLTLFGKIGYEYLMHKSHIMLTFYKKIFE
jgi:hypothetical protein